MRSNFTNRGARLEVGLSAATQAASSYSKRKRCHSDIWDGGAVTMTCVPLGAQDQYPSGNWLRMAAQKVR